MYCANCGKYLLDTDRFCSNCGTPVAQGGKPEAPAGFAGADTPEPPTDYVPKHTVTPPPSGEIKWDVKAFPDHSPKPTEEIDFDWGDTGIFRKNLPPKEEIAFAPGGFEEPSQREEAGVIPGADVTEDIPLTGKDLEDEIFADAALLERIPAGGEQQKKTTKVEKFYTFNKKNEEFQQLLDKEYERIKRGEEDASGGAVFSAGVMEINRRNDEPWPEFNPAEHIAEMALAREMFFGSPDPQNPNPAPGDLQEAEDEALYAPVAREPGMPEEAAPDQPEPELEVIPQTEPEIEPQPEPEPEIEPQPQPEPELEVISQTEPEIEPQPEPEPEIKPQPEGESEVLTQTEPEAETQPEPSVDPGEPQSQEAEAPPAEAAEQDQKTPEATEGQDSTDSQAQKDLPQDDVLSMRERWVKFEEEEEEGGEDGESGGRAGKIIIGILVILLLIQLALLGIRYMAPESAVSQYMDDKVDKVLTFFTGSDNQSIALTDRETAASDKTGVIQLALDENQGEAIQTIKYNPDLRYDYSGDYQDEDLASAQLLEENIWYEDAEGSPVYYDQEAISCVIAYESSRELAEGDVFQTLEIGEIFINDNTIFVWIATDTTLTGREEKILRIEIGETTMEVTGEYDA